MTAFSTQSEFRIKADNIVSMMKPHRDYKRTVDHADWCFQTMQGKQTLEALVTYRTTESQEQKKQRFRLYNSRTGEVGYKVEKLFNEVHRSDNIVDEIRAVKEDPEGISLLKNALDNFDQVMGRDFKKYLNETYRHLNFYDPNSWILIEFSDEADERFVWSVEISSKEAFNYEYEFGQLQYLVIKRSLTYKRKGGDGADKSTVEGEHFFVYTPGFVMEYRIIPENALWVVLKDYKERTMQIQHDTQKRAQKVLYREYTNDLTDVPAKRVGYFQDAITTLRSFVSPISPAENVFRDLVVRKMEYDLSHACHGYFQKYQYVKPCVHCGGTGSVDRESDIYRGEDGARRYDDKPCQKCDGTGKISHSSVQDIIDLKLPDDKADLVPLRDLIYYAEIPKHLFTLQKDDIEQSKKDVYSAIFSEHVFDRSQVATTATENKLNWRSVYNALHPYAQGYSSMYIWGVGQIAQIIGIDTKNLLVMHAISSDFSLETVDELLIQRTAAVGAKAPDQVIRHIDSSILSQQNKGNPEYVAIEVAKAQFYPFRGKSETEISMLIGHLSSREHPLWIQFLYFDQIFFDIFVAHPDFHLMKFPEQKEIYEAFVQLYIIREEQINAGGESFADNLLGSGSGPQNTDVDGDSTKTGKGESGEDEGEGEGGEEDASADGSGGANAS